ncbi:ubiquitin interaction domain-containing protein [Blastomyces gilchristii SLH14081]|uniref:Ubiquitin interaction domain-containing protein n=1 Tax=Blastomyces gilchristii (strain SLH14081) TaxID=559298 RepID=A0A179U9S7_BLAGS|nr:ubiquitin interaction domain-containing protein [Blastomyces gilchristii SLH14081]OAT04600.1 ubiquitin interaction domain-containing protein [Blastomyces gilchristii SLH14081]
MMTSVDLPEDAIENFISFTNASREKAVAFLEANNRDSNRAINAYFENPDSIQPEPTVAWPMPPSSQQEGYGYQNQNIHSFRIDSDPVHPVGYGTAPSRPPSRIGSRERTDEAKVGQPIEGLLNKPAAGTGPSQHMSLAEQEEHELQRAVALSLNAELGGNGDISIDGGGQETGVINTNQTKLAPATQNHYEETAWALTLLEPAAREVCMHPDPEERMRVSNEPVFLRPSDEADYLAGFLTILHSIPLAREALLLRDKVIDDYGSDPQWWNGQPINLPSLVTLADDGYMDESGHDDVLLEVQRLMTFLDSTHRAFGSIDALANLKSIQSWNTEYNVGQFLESWQRAAVAATPNNQLATIFSSLAYKRPLSVDEEPIDKEFLALELPVHSDLVETLYDAIDISMWQDSADSELDDIWLDRIGEVFTLQLNSTDTQKSVDVKIPAVWYPDRYMEACRDISREIRKRRIETSVEVDKLQHLMRLFSASTIDHSTSQTRNTFDLAVSALQVASRNNLVNGSVGDPEMQEQTVVSHEAAMNLTKELKALTEKIDQKLRSLEERRVQALEALRRYSKELTTASNDPAKPPHNKYTLRGVCTHPHVTYVLRRREMSIEGTDERSSTNSAPDEWQWWRISFSVDDATARHAESTQTPVVPSLHQCSAIPQELRKPRVPLPSNMDVAGYTVRPVREIEVLRAAKEEARSVLLVYANENAVNFKEGPLPPQLQAFVDADNKVFESEREEFAQKLQQQAEEEPAKGSDNSWPDLEPLGGEFDETSSAQKQTSGKASGLEHAPAPSSSSVSGEEPTGTRQTGRNAAGNSNHKKHYSWDDRIPASLLPESSAFDSNTINVFDYQVSSFPDTPPSEPEDKEPEMQERGVGGGGMAILRQAGSSGSGSVKRSVQPAVSMGRIQEEIDDDGEDDSSGNSRGPGDMRVDYDNPASRTAGGLRPYVLVGGDFSHFARECLKYHGTEVPWINQLLRKCMLNRGHDETLFGHPILKLPGVEGRDLVVQSLQLSIRECSEPEDEQMCNLIEDLIREQNLLENEQEQSSSADKAQLSILRVPVSQKLVNDFVDTLKLPGKEQDKSKECIRCHCPPISAHLTSCLHIYCQDCAEETMI